MATMAAPVAGSGNQPTAQQLNAAQRKLVLQQSVRMKQSVASGTINPALVPVINVIPRNVGLITRFIVEFTATFAELGSGSTAATDFAAYNVFSNIQFTDLQNNQRHNTYGMHFGLLSSFKERMAWLSAFSFAQKEGNYGANWTLTSVTPPTTTNGGTVKGFLEIPIAYSDHDLRGAIYANVVANQMQLQLTPNPNPGPTSGDDTFAVFYGSGATTMTSLTYNVYQEYLDQLPMGASGVVLPSLDISTVYQLLWSPFNNIAQGQDFYVQYTNFRRFLSVTALYNSTGTVGGRLTGADIDYWALVSANFTNIWKTDPYETARVARRILGCDPPPGVYYFSSREKPIYTLTYGNMQLDLNPSVAGANAYLNIFWEFLALQNTLSSAGSLPANG